MAGTARSREACWSAPGAMSCSAPAVTSDTAATASFSSGSQGIPAALRLARIACIVAMTCAIFSVLSSSQLIELISRFSASSEYIFSRLKVVRRLANTASSPVLLLANTRSGVA